MSKGFYPHEVVWTHENVAHFWSYYSKKQAEDAQFFSHQFGKSILTFARRHIAFANQRILDFGCGAGSLIGHLLDMGISCEVQAIERSAECVDVVRKKFGSHPMFRGVNEMTRLPVPCDDDSVDVVFLVEVLEHLLASEFVPTVQEIGRILRRGGHAVVTVPNDENLEGSKVICPECGGVFHRWQHQRSFTSGSLASLMEGAGFITLICRPTTFTTGSLLDPARRIYHFLEGSRPHLVYIGQKA